MDSAGRGGAGRYAVLLGPARRRTSRPLIVYADTSALVPLIREEATSAPLRSWLAAHRPRLVTSAIGVVELRRVAARIGERHVALADALAAEVDVLRLTEANLELAGGVGPASLRTLDAIHLAAAAMVADLDVLLCYDQRLGDAARGIGMVVVGPLSGSDLGRSGA